MNSRLIYLLSFGLLSFVLAMPQHVEAKSYIAYISDETFVPDFQGVIETDDGAVVFFDWHGYGRAYPQNARQIVLSATHLSDDDRYRWLNDVVCVGTGEVRPTELIVEIAEVLWEPPED